MKISNCKITGKKTKKIVNFGKMPIANGFLKRQEFSKEFSSLTPIDYVKTILVEKLNAKHVVIGYDHHFGYKRV